MSEKNLFDMFTNNLSNLNRKGNGTILMFVRKLNNLASISNINTRKTTYNNKGNLLNMHLITNTVQTLSILLFVTLPTI